MTVIHTILEAIGLCWVLCMLLLLALIGSSEIRRLLSKRFTKLSLEQEFELIKHQVANKSSESQ